MSTKICAASDVIITDKFPKEYKPSVLSEKINEADLKTFNLEIVISDKPVFGSAYCGGTWLITGTQQLDEALKFGFNSCGWANNHTMDYSYDGLISTKEALKDRNFPACGAGESLTEASRFAKIEENSKKFGLISICSTFNDAARAGNEASGMPARPGLNPLRFSTVYNITPEHMKALREISEGTKIDGRRNRSRAGGYTPYPPEGCFGFGDYTFAESEIEGKISKANKNDLLRTEEEIKRALLECEYVAVMVHSHEIKGDTDDTPEDFLAEFAHTCIDAGACAVFGGGTHQLKGIEIYNGKPIFYSLGNFIFQSDSTSVMPADFAEKYGYPAGLKAADQIALRTKNGTIGLHADRNNFLSIMPMLTFENGELMSIELNPLTLSHDYGLPMLSSEEDTQFIYDVLCRLSKVYGTELVIDGNQILWRKK